MCDRGMRAAPVVNEDGRVPVLDGLIIHKDHREADGVDVVYEARAHLPRDNYPIDIPLEKEARNTMRLAKCIRNGCQDDIVIVVACLEFRPEKDPRVERFRLREMVFAQDESEITAGP